MINKIDNSNSFKGNIIVSTWKDMRPNVKTYRTTIAQDNMLHDFFNDKAPLFDTSYLSKSNSIFFQKLLETMFLIKLPFLKTPKSVYNYGDCIHIQDNCYKLLNGSEITIEFFK